MSSEYETVERPWGNYRVLLKGEGFQVKELNVNPGGAISLQYHRQRTEYWIPVQGVATVTLGGTDFVLHLGEKACVPPGQSHRLANNEVDVLRVVEIQFGTYLGEDDIVRLEDRYGRV